MSIPNGVPQSPTWFCRTTRVPEVLQRARQRVADDRGAQVPDVHLLGHVGRGVVDRDDLPLLRRYAERGSSSDLDLRGQPLRAQRDVDEARGR